MEQHPINQSAFSRAVSDTVSAQRSTKFMWGGEGVLAVAGGAWLVQIAQSGVSTSEVVARSVIGALGGLLTAVLVIFVWNLFRAPYKQRDEARQRIKELQTEFEKPKLFDILCPTTSFGLPINKLEDGSYRAGAMSIGFKPLQVLHRGDLATINRFTMTPRILFIQKDKGWETTTAITLSPGSNPLASSRSRNLSWNAQNPLQWVLDGLPITLAKDEALTLPIMVIKVDDGNEVGGRLDKGETCTLLMSFGIFTDKGSPLLADQQIPLTRSDIKVSFFKPGGGV